MAPVPDSELAGVPAVAVGAVGLLASVVLVLLCADGGGEKEDKQKNRRTQKMKKMDQFTNIGGAGTTDTAGKAKVRLKATVPMQSPAQTAPKGKVKVEQLGLDAMAILKKAFKDDKSLSRLIIDEKRLTVLDIVGQGNFGLVYKGMLVDKNMNNPRDVAVKTVHGANCSTDDVELFIKESARMRGFAHQNVMCITGIVTKDNKPYIVLPFMNKGDLKSYVANKSLSFTLEDLVRMGNGVAQGMAYLSTKNFIHRDLAARNCMVTADGTVKVADFGLSRDLYQADYYKMSNLQTPLPLRWVALECIMTSKFTTKSDVWSFGVLLWELVTRGKNPYPGIRENIEVLKYIRDGKRLAVPAYVTDNLKDVMMKCWESNPNNRPTFEKISTTLHYILEGDDDYLKPQKQRKT